MIREFYINHFKSLVNFQIQLDKLTCLIGLNGSGKSTILQAIDFTTQLIKGHIEDWLKTREWGPEDLLYFFEPDENIDFVIKLQFEKSSYSWRGEFNTNTLTCPNEEIVNDTRGKRSVIFTYKNKQGITQQRPFFKIKGVAEKLDILGQGEAMLDVSLNELAQELSYD